MDLLEVKVQDLENKINVLEGEIHKLRRARTWSRTFKLIYLLFFIIIGLVMFYYLRPVYEQLGQIYNHSPESGLDVNIENIDPNQIQNILNRFDY